MPAINKKIESSTPESRLKSRRSIHYREEPGLEENPLSPIQLVKSPNRKYERKLNITPGVINKMSESSTEDEDSDSNEEVISDRKTVTKVKRLGNSPKKQNVVASKYKLDRGTEILYTQKSKQKETATLPVDKITLFYNELGKNIHLTAVVILVFALLGFFILFPSASKITKNQTVSIHTVKQRYPTQEPLLWKAIEKGVRDIVALDRPSSFIFLYNDNNNLIGEIVKDISHYATCNLSSCDNPPVILSNNILNSTEVVDDFGIIITRFRDDLEKSSVMVIPNVENIPGKTAQVFHSFCDEFNPVQKRALFLFTMKVDNFSRNVKDDIRYVERILRVNWSDIKTDTFDPLFTRISSMILRVNP